MVQSKVECTLASKPLMSSSTDDAMYASSYSGATFGEGYTSDNEDRKHISATGSVTFIDYPDKLVYITFKTSLLHLKVFHFLFIFCVHIAKFYAM
jgi:hypothetical protein